MRTEAVRPEYEALARGFTALASHFALRVGPALQRDMTLVCAAFETIDRHVDAIAEDLERRALQEDVVARVRGDTSRANGAEPMHDEVASVLHELRTRVSRCRSRRARCGSSF